MAINDIQNYYDSLINQKKKAKLDTLSGQESDYNGQLGVIKQLYDAKKQETNNNYNTAVTEQNNKQTQGEQDFYNQGNRAVVNNTSNRNRVKAWLDANNLGQSYSVVDAMQNADNQLANAAGKVNSDKNVFMKGIADNLAKIRSDNTQQLSSIGAQEASDTSAIQNKIADILRQRQGLDNNTDSDILGIETEKAKAIADEQARVEETARQEAEAEKQRQYEAQQAEIQRQFQTQQAALERQASVAKASASTSSKTSTAAAKQQQQNAENALWAQFQDEFNKGNADDWLTQYGPQIMRDYSPSVYNSLVDQLNKYKTVFANNRKNAYEDQDANTNKGYYVTNGGRMLIE